MEELTILPDNSLSSVAILGGTGQQGRGLAQRLAHAGMQVIVGSRDAARAKEAVASWPVAAGSASIEAASNRDAVAGAPVVVLAVPFTTVDELLRELHPVFVSGAVVIDVTVPVAFVAGKMTMAAVPEGSAAEHVRALLPAHVGLACAFKTVPAHLLGDRTAPLDCDEFVCGDSEDARRKAAALVSLLPGLRPVDVGPLSRARSIEHVTVLAIAINRKHKIHDARFRVVGL